MGAGSGWGGRLRRGVGSDLGMESQATWQGLA